MGWRVIIIWECALKGKEKLCLEDIGRTIGAWLATEEKTMVIRGRENSVLV